MECQALTNKGVKCFRKTSNTLCWQHNKALIPELESIVSEYVENESYLELLKYDIQYTLDKREKMLALKYTKEIKEELKDVDELIDQWKVNPLNSKYVYDILDAKKYRIYDLFDIVSEALFELKIAKVDLTDTYFEDIKDENGKPTITISMLSLSNYKGLDDIIANGEEDETGALKLSDDLSGLYFETDENIYNIELTPLWNLIYSLIKDLYLFYTVEYREYYLIH